MGANEERTDAGAPDGSTAALEETRAVGRAIRTPRAAALAGIAFSVLFAVALVLLHEVVPEDPEDAGQWLADSSRRGAVVFALGLVPFAGIAFLWFVGVIRDRVGDAEDRFFATVFLGSGLLFVAMLFVAAAVAAGVVSVAGDDADRLVATGTWAVGRRTVNELMLVYALRMAAVFTLATSTILLRARVAPRWLAVSGYAIAAMLLLTVGHLPWVELLFPAWVLVLSAHVLVAGWRSGRSA